MATSKYLISLLTEQPPPVNTEYSRSIIESLRKLYQNRPLIRLTLEARAAQGRKKYKTYLKSYNGRRVMADLTQEFADAVFYAQQGILENQREDQTPLREVYEVIRTSAASVLTYIANAEELENPTPAPELAPELETELETEEQAA